MSQPLTTWYLEMHAPSELQAARRHPDLQIMECEYTQFEVNRFGYSFVGGSWQRTDKLRWSDAQLPNCQARGFKPYKKETTG